MAQCCWYKPGIFSSAFVPSSSQRSHITPPSHHHHHHQQPQNRTKLSNRNLNSEETWSFSLSNVQTASSGNETSTVHRRGSPKKLSFRSLLLLNPILSWSCNLTTPGASQVRKASRVSRLITSPKNHLRKVLLNLSIPHVPHVDWGKI